MELHKDSARMCTMTPNERFDVKYDVVENGCWEWKGRFKKNRSHGAEFMVKGKKMVAARFSYERYIGQIPAGMYVQHPCGSVSCVNQEHLNVAGSPTSGTRLKRPIPDKCRHGHKYVPCYSPKGTTKNIRCSECAGIERKRQKMIERGKNKALLAEEYATLAVLSVEDVKEGREKIPSVLKSCVYFLFDAHEVVYVGMSSGNPLTRVGVHCEKYVFDSYSYIEVEQNIAYRTEAAYINKFCPKYNMTARLGNT